MMNRRYPIAVGHKRPKDVDAEDWREPHGGYRLGMTMRATTRPWACQLLHVEETGTAVGLDLIALDPCPFPSIELPPGTPFVIRVVQERAAEFAELVRSWADDGAVVTIRLVDMPPGRWLCLSGDDRNVLLEMTA